MIYYTKLQKVERANAAANLFTATTLKRRYRSLQFLPGNIDIVLPVFFCIFGYLIPSYLTLLVMLNSLWWMIFYVLLLFTSLLLGIRYGTVYKKKRSWESSGIENAIIGIFGLIISFTFLQAGNAHRERSANLHREVNNIDMLYRYSRELPDSMYQYTRNMLSVFLQNQLVYEKTGDVTTFATAQKMSDVYWQNLRTFKKQATPEQAETVDKISGYFEQIMAAATLYAYANYERTPVFIMFLLITVSLLIGFLVGFMNGIKSRVHYLVPVIYFVTISLTMLVISDLNNPRIGLIRPGYHHIQAAYDFIKQQ